MILELLLLLLAIYLLSGLAFAIPFVWVGVGIIDPHAAQGSWGFRLLIIPGTMFFWPLLAARWIKGAGEPRPEAHNTRPRAGWQVSCQETPSARSQVENPERPIE